ncbi:MAG: hypothetical protein DI616_08980 [Paracoccus denitrificans]|uniref:Polysaccharide export protein n=1 Tax=Paracoccus denitrificans TaxID=266 RepID=A0A533I7C1_PARDE|nr:MAG: hypothetical protein DI616_08980 [Paracoccus denitrificans]
MRMRAAAGTMLCAWLALSTGAAAEPYSLHAQDGLMIRVITWDYQLNNPTAWQGLSGEYTISADGELQLPLAGTLQAVGRTTADLRDEIGNLLRLRAGLEDAPQLSVELIDSLPVYVLGDVNTQGAVPFRPGLTARQAMALAGGMYRSPAARGPAQMIALTGELAAAEQALRALNTEQARIQQELAELSGETSDAAPSTPADGAQDQLQDADRTARQVRIDSYATLRNMLEEKGQRLNQQLQLRDQQIANTREELAGITTLNERGLAVNARVTSLETALTDLETKRLDLETALLLLDTQLNQATLDGDTITTDAVADRLRRLTELEGEIPAATIRADTARQLLQTELAYGAAETADPARPQPDFNLTRDSETRKVDPDTPLRPGDTLDVLLPLDAQATDTPD